MTTDSDSARKDPMMTSTPTEATYSRENPPPPPTAEQTRERYERQRRADADAEARLQEETREAQIATKQRLAALAEKLKSKPSTLHEDAEKYAGDSWTDLGDHQAEIRRRRWWTSIEDSHKQSLAFLQLDEIEDPQARTRLTMWVDQLERDGSAALHLVLSGPVGSGKTSAAMAVGHRAVARGMSVKFVSHNRYLAMLQPGGQPDGMTKDQVRNAYRRGADLLILDDFGAEFDVPDTTNPDAPKVKPVSEYAAKETLELVSDRLQSGLATLFTTNLTSPQVLKMFGPRTYSRIGQGAIGVKLTGTDRRSPITW